MPQKGSSESPPGDVMLRELSSQSDRSSSPRDDQDLHNKLAKNLSRNLKIVRRRQSEAHRQKYIDLGRFRSALEEQLAVHQAFRNLCVYVVVFSLYVIMQHTRGQLSMRDYQISQAILDPIRKEFKDASNKMRGFDTISSLEDIKMWFAGPLMSAVVPETISPDLGTVVLRPGMWRMSPVMIRQFRVVNESVCKGTSYYAKDPDYGFGAQLLRGVPVFCEWQPDKSNGAKEPFGTSGKFKYSAGNDFRLTSMSSSKTGSYGTGSYLLEVPIDKNRSEAKRWIKKEVLEEGFIDDASRMIVVSFMVHAPAMGDLFTWCRFYFEVLAMGTIRSRAAVQTFALYPSFSPQVMKQSPGTFAISLIVAIVVLVNEGLIKIVFVLRKTSKQYGYFRAIKMFLSSWANILDTTVLITVISQFVLEFIVYFTFLHQNFQETSFFSFPNARLDPAIQRDFWPCARWSRHYNILCGLNLALSLLKVFKYLNEKKRFTVLWKTITAAASDLVITCFILALFVVAFAFVAMRSFGCYMQEFSSPMDSIYILLMMLFGEYAFLPRMLKVSKVTPWYMIVYMLIVVLVVINLFIAVVMEAYEHVKSSQSIRSQFTDKHMHALAGKGAAKFFRHVRAAIAARSLKQLMEYKSDVRKLFEVTTRLTNQLVDMGTDGLEVYLCGDPIPGNADNPDLFSQERGLKLVTISSFRSALSRAGFVSSRIDRYVATFRFDPSQFHSDSQEVRPFNTVACEDLENAVDNISAQLEVLRKLQRRHPSASVSFFPTRDWAAARRWVESQPGISQVPGIENLCSGLRMLERKFD